MSTTIETRTLEVPGARLVYDVQRPTGRTDAPPLLLVGQPMDAAGFRTLASHLADRTVLTYDPRGLGRSTREADGPEHRPQEQAEDLHRLIEAVGGGPVDVMGSSGGAITALALAAAHPEVLRTVVAHEPPLLAVLPDASAAGEAWARVVEIYHRQGWGAGMAAFIQLTSWLGELPEGFLDTAPDPAALGLPAEDDGSRDDPLLSGVSSPVTAYRPDVATLRRGPVRLVVAAGTESEGTVTWRTSAALAAALGQELVVFPSHHGGFLGDEYGQAGQPEPWAARLREVLAADRG